jgi:hypothetical protein
MTENVRSSDVPCPICGAALQEACKLTWGGSRFESHAERKWIAMDIRHTIAFQIHTVKARARHRVHRGKSLTGQSLTSSS